MKRYNVYLREDQVEKLKIIAQATELSAANLVRRAINQYIQRYAKTQEI